MWPGRAGRSQLLLALGASTLEAAWQDAGHGEWRVAASALPPGETGSGSVLAALQDVVATLRVAGADFDGGDAHVAVHDVWLASGSIPWSRELVDGASANGYVQRRLEDLGFEADDLVSRLDAAGYGEPAAVVGYPRWLVSAIHGAAPGVALRGMLPWSTLAADALPPARGRLSTLAILEAGAVVLVHRDDSETGMRTRRVEPGSESQVLLDLLKRSDLRSGGPVATMEGLDLVLADDVAVTDALRPHARALGTPGAGTLSKRLQLAARVRDLRLPLDAVDRTPRLTPARSVAVVLSAVAAAVAIGWALREEQALVALNAASAPAPVVRAAAPWTRAERARAAAANEAIGQLNLPIAAVSAALMPPRDIRAGVLSFETSSRSGDPDASGGQIRVSAETPTGEEMARYVSWLSSRKVLRDVWLVRHERVDSPTGPRYRFVAEAQWRD